MKIWWWLYLCNFILAAMVAVPLMSVLEEKLGHSFAVQQLMEGFNYTVFTDFMNEYGEAITPILSQSKLVIMLYVLLSVFLMGGILESCKNHLQKVNFQVFAVGAIKYFLRLILMTICFLLLHGLLFYGFFKLFMWLIEGGDLKQLDSELVIYYRGGIVLIIYLFFAGILATIHDFAKIDLVENNPKWGFSAILNGGKLVFNNCVSTLFLSFLNWLTFGLIALIYLVLRGDDLNSTVGELWFIFFLGQAFILIRMGLKILNLKSKMFLYKQQETLF